MGRSWQGPGQALAHFFQIRAQQAKVLPLRVKFCLDQLGQPSGGFAATSPQGGEE